VLLPLGWWVCVSLLVPARVPAPAAPLLTQPARPPAAPSELAAKIDAYFTAAAATLPGGPSGALARIPDLERRRLAVAHYLRRLDQVDSLWSWSPEEARARQKSADYRRAMRELRRVRQTFARQNPGYVLVTDTNPRPLLTQLRYWNHEPSVFAVARELSDSAASWLAPELFPAQPDSSGVARFVHRLETFMPHRIPTVAVPGLSLHGRGRAFDFAILRRGMVVAGTSSSTIDSTWKAAGWGARLRHAVIEAGETFVGPLATPPEPWHYEVSARATTP